MKFAKTIIFAAMMFGMGSLANAASVFQTTTLYTATADALDIVFEWNGTPSSGLETLDISTLLPTWDIQLKTNPQPPEATAGIFVKPTHSGNPDAEGRTIYFTYKDTLSWKVSHTATGVGHFDEFSLQYLSVDTDGSGNVIGARLHLEGKHGAAPVPVPAAVWLFGSGLIVMAGLGRLRRGRVLDAIPS